LRAFRFRRIWRSPRKHEGSSPGKVEQKSPTKPASSSPLKPKTLGALKNQLERSGKVGGKVKKAPSQRKLEFAKRSRSPSPVSSKTKGKAKSKGKTGGRKSGRSNWTDARIKSLLDAVEKVRPVGARDWEDVATEYYRLTKELRDYSALRRQFRKLARTKPKTGQSTVPPLIVRARNLGDAIIQKALSKEIDDVIDEGEIFESGDETEDYNESGDERDSPESSSQEVDQPASPQPSPLKQTPRSQARLDAEAEAKAASKPKAKSASAKSTKKRSRASLMPTAEFDLAADSPAAKGRRRVDSSINNLAKTMSSSIESAANPVNSMLPMMAMLNQMGQQNMMAMAAMFGRGPFAQPAPAAPAALAAPAAPAAAAPAPAAPAAFDA